MHMTNKVVKVKRKLVIMKNRVVRMKGMVVMIGYIKGYEIRTLSSRKIKKDGFTALLGEDIRETALDALEHKGLAYGLYNKEKQCCLAMIFRKQAIEFNGREVTAFVPVESRSSEGCEVLMTEFEELIRRELNEYISWSDTKYYMLGGEVMDYETLRASRKAQNSGMIFVFILVGIIMKNFGLAIALMLIFGCSPISEMSGSKNKKADGKETAADAT